MSNTVESVSAARKMISCSASATSSNAQLRKIKKPLIERRRRERINECLGQLKALVLEATNKDESRYSKMEKADILEMTVAHLKFVHSARRSCVDAGRAAGFHGAVLSAAAASLSDGETSGGVRTSASAAVRYLTGYNECVREVASYLAGDAAAAGDAKARLGDDVRTALMRHLDDYLRLRAAATQPPHISAANHHHHPPSADIAAAVAGSCGRFGAAVATVDARRTGTSSPSSSVELAVDLAGATPWRRRCDSGVYSAASSPAEADELAASTPAALPSPLELTTSTRETTPTTLILTSPPRHGATQLQTQDVSSVTSEVWRPW